MGAPLPDLEKAENASAEALLDSLKTIDPAERRKHASVFSYWLSIRANRQFPPIRDLDPIEISDAGPWSVLLEMIGGGEDAIVRHCGQAIRGGVDIDRIADAPDPSLLHCIHGKLPIVAACREAYAFEEVFEGEDGPTRCWVTLLPFSATGTWIDFVYGYVSLDGAEDHVATTVEATEEVEVPAGQEPEASFAESVVEPMVEEDAAAEEWEEPEPFTVPLGPLDQILDAEPEESFEPASTTPEAAPVTVHEAEPESEAEPAAEYAPEQEAEFEPEPVDAEAEGRPSFTSKFMESIGGFYGKVVQTGPELPPDAFVEEEGPFAADEPAAEEATVEQFVPEPAYALEGTLQNKLTDVRALADEAREAQVRSNLALYEGLSAAYDFALDAEAEPEEYLRLVEAQGLKIQLRSPMKPVVRLAFDGTCDEPTIAQLEAVLSWALKHDLPRGTLAERIQEEGGIGQILNAKAA